MFLSMYMKSEMKRYNKKHLNLNSKLAFSPDDSSFS